MSQINLIILKEANACFIELQQHILVKVISVCQTFTRTPTLQNLIISNIYNRNNINLFHLFLKKTAFFYCFRLSLSKRREEKYTWESRRGRRCVHRRASPVCVSIVSDTPGYKSHDATHPHQFISAARLCFYFRLHHSSLPWKWGLFWPFWDSSRSSIQRLLIVSENQFTLMNWLFTVDFPPTSRLYCSFLSVKLNPDTIVFFFPAHARYSQVSGIHFDCTPEVKVSSFSPWHMQ